MSFVNRLPTVVPGFGSPLQNDVLFLTQNVSIAAAGPTTFSLTGLTPTISRGYIRVKIYGAAGTTPTIVLVDVVVTDGTTFVIVGRINPATAIPLSTTAAAGSPYTNGGTLAAGLATPGGIDFLFPFLVDINVNQVSVDITLGGTTPTGKLDLEVSGVS